ncbi:MAG: AraC family transcriptional regulator, partial [Cruoricaptor ignavus]|nr:AraC family transcriptional regulator [Cruoricaptor ignavus]
MTSEFVIETITDFSSPIPLLPEFYTVVVCNGGSSYEVDFNQYQALGSHIIFLTPYQHFKFLDYQGENLTYIQFNAEFYCIEFHRNDVACNGLLFNNIYSENHISVTDEIYAEICFTVKRMQTENQLCNPYSESLLKTYLQLILALCSKEKKFRLDEMAEKHTFFPEYLQFQEMLERFYQKEHSPTFYASEIGISTDALTKKIKAEVGKTPKQLINERIILEAKKLLQLTTKSVKEISWEL